MPVARTENDFSEALSDQNPVSTFILHHVQMIFIDKAIVMM